MLGFKIWTYQHVTPCCLVNSCQNLYCLCRHSQAIQEEQPFEPENGRHHYPMKWWELLASPYSVTSQKTCVWQQWKEKLKSLRVYMGISEMFTWVYLKWLRGYIWNVYVDISEMFMWIYLKCLRGYIWNVYVDISEIRTPYSLLLRTDCLGHCIVIPHSHFC